MAGIRSKDLSCKNKLGHPRLFASLSQQWAKATLLDTCDGTVTLHDVKQAAMWKHTVWPKLPPNKWEKHQPSKHDDALITVLWDQLAKVDYFSPLLWRVDVYGNVLYRFADAGTPLSWSVDHLFPVARGGLSKAANLRIIQSQAHLNKADELEFLLTRDMACTGLSMLDFKVQVKHSMEALLIRYGKQATALPVQATPPRGATLDRQHPSKSRGVSQQQGYSYSKEDVPLGLKATRVAHAAAVSSRVFSPSMRSPMSGQVQPSALPSQHELADTLGFVQRQGSFHSEHAVQHLMTDQAPLQPSSRHLSKLASLPSQRSLQQHDSADSRRRQSSKPRHSDASDHQSQHSYGSAPRTYSSSRYSQHSQGGYSQRPPLGNSQIIAHSALFQTIPVSPRNGHIPSDQFEETDHKPHGLPAASQHSYQAHLPSGYDNHQSCSHATPHARSPSPATAVARRDSYQPDASRVQDYPPEPSYHSSAAAAAAPAAAAGTPPTAFQSADSFSSDMLSSDNNQTEQWDNSMLQRIQEGSEQAAAPASQQGAPAHSRLTDGALQSVDSFASDALSTDMTHTAHWGKSMSSEMQRVAEEEKQQELASHQEPAMHAVLDLNLEGMHPPTNQAEAGPHDWLWLPDELSTINDSEFSSIDGVRPDIDTWLAQQQASRLASAAQHGGGSSSRRDPRLQQASHRAQHAQQGSSSFKRPGRLQQAVSPISPLNTADSLDSIYGEHHQAAAPSQAGDPVPKAHSSLPWAENCSPATYRYSPEPATTSHARVAGNSQAPSSAPLVFPSQTSEYTSPFAHWSSSPILGASTRLDQAAVSTYDPQQQQQQQQTAPHSRSGLPQDHTYNMDTASAKQQELDDRLAALDTLEFPGEADMFEGFGSPVQTGHTASGRAPADAYGHQLYNTEAPLPVDAPGATLSAPEEALLASMREMLHDHQSADKQHSGPFDTQASTAATPKPDYTSTSTTADSITFHTPPAGRSLSNPRAASNSPGPVAPTTPDHTPALPPCKVNPMSSFPSKRASQHTGRNKDDDVLSSFQQLLRSPDGDQQDRMSKFRQLLASQEMDDEGKPLSGLAGRVRTMAAQLNALQKRTQELQLASSPSRRASSPFSCRLSRAGSQTGSTQSLAALSSTSRRARGEPNSPNSSLGRAVAHSPVSSQGGALRGRGFHKSLSARATTDIELFSSYATGS